MMRSFLAFVLASLALAHLPADGRAQGRSTDWPQFRGPGGMGVSPTALPEKWSATDNVAWKVELPGAGGSSPVIFGDRIYLTTYSGYNVPGERAGDMDQLKRHVVCLDRATGKLIWKRDLDSKLPEQDRIRDDHGYATNTPAVDAEGLVAFFGKTGVVALDLTGKVLWQADVGDKLNGWGSAASPIFFENLVIINASVESESLIALDRKTGKEVWRKGRMRESWCTPILVKNPKGGTELVLAIFGKILGIDPKSGDELWSCATEIGWYMVPSLVARDGIVYCIGGRSGDGLAVRAGGSGDVSRSHLVWRMKRGSNVSSPVLHGEHLYWVNDNNEIAYCAELKTGDIVYQERLPRAGQFYASPILADGKVYYLSRHGRTFVVAAKPSFEILATNDLGGRDIFNASPAASGGKLFLRSQRFLYCIGE